MLSTTWCRLCHCNMVVPSTGLSCLRVSDVPEFVELMQVFLAECAEDSLEFCVLRFRPRSPGPAHR